MNKMKIHGPRVKKQITMRGGSWDNMHRQVTWGRGEGEATKGHDEAKASGNRGSVEASPIVDTSTLGCTKWGEQNIHSLDILPARVARMGRIRWVIENGAGM